MTRRFDKLGFLRNGLTVCITSNVDPGKVAIGINENVDLDSSRAIARIEQHGEYAPAAPTRGNQWLQARRLRNSQVVAIASAIANSGNRTRVKVLKEQCGRRNVFARRQKSGPLTGLIDVIHVAALSTRGLLQRLKWCSAMMRI
jgi:hypothetical protein